MMLSTFTVTDTSDSVNDPGSLRHVLTASNQSGPGPNTIDFNIPTSDPGFNATTQTWTLAPASALPAISVPVVIDAYSQPGAAPDSNGPGLGDNAILKIELDGNNAGTAASGLTVTGSGGGSTISGLAISSFANAAVLVKGSNGNVISGNFLGTDVKGESVGPGPTVSQSGVELAGGAAHNTVGGATADAGNVLAGNQLGLFFHLDQGTASTTDNVVEGNFIGTDAAGTKAIPNQLGGIRLQSEIGDQIGRPNPGERNLISGNTSDGIDLILRAIGGGDNLVEGNFIGTDVTPKVAVANGNAGVLTEDDGNDTIGGTVSGAGNLISGNLGSQINVFAPDVSVEGNLIGTDITGTAQLSSQQGGGIAVGDGGAGGGSATIGGTASGARNVISGTVGGINIQVVSNNVIEGNFIGLNADGTAAIPGIGVTAGIEIFTKSNTIGGTTAGAGNVIAGQLGNAIALFAGSNVVQGNLIGTDATGKAAIGNGGFGVVMDIGGGSSSNVVGGSAPGAANVIANNASGGVLVGRESTSDLISRNAIFNNHQGNIVVNAGGNPGITPPELASVTNNADGSLTVQGSLANVTAGANFTIELFASASGGPPVGGQTFIEAVTATGAQNGTADFSATFKPVAQESFISATATDANNNTSAFSNGLQEPNSPVTVDTTTTLRVSAQAVTVGQSVTFTTVVAPQSGSGIPSGDVNFTVDQGAPQSVRLEVVNGIVEAVLVDSSLSVGSHTAIAAYGGTPQFDISTSKSVTVQVNAAPISIDTVTVLKASANPVNAGQPVTFTALVTPQTGTIPPAGDVTFAVDDGTAQSVPLAIVNGVAEAVFAVSSLALGTNTVSATYEGNSQFDSSPAVPLKEMVNAAISPPTVGSTERFGFHNQPTSIVLTFTAALDPAQAEDVRNYQIETLGGHGRGGDPIGQITGVARADYDPASLTVTLYTTARLDIHNVYRLTVDGAAPPGVTGATGIPLDGERNGDPGSKYTTLLTSKTLAGPAPGWVRVPGTTRYRPAPDSERPPAPAVDALAAAGALSVGRGVRGLAFEK